MAFTEQEHVFKINFQTNEGISHIFFTLKQTARMTFVKPCSLLEIDLYKERFVPKHIDRAFLFKT